VSYQAWEDLLEDGDEPAGNAASPSQAGGLGTSAGEGGGLDPEAVLHEVPGLAELLRQRGELEQRMASLLGGQTPGTGNDAVRERLRVGAPPATAAERAAARQSEAQDTTRRELTRQRAAQRREHEDGEAQRRQHLLDRGRRRLLAQQQRLLDAERRRGQHQLELAEQRYIAPERDGAARHPGHDLADVVDRARTPLREWKTQREQLQGQLREQLAKAKQDPQLQEALRDDPTALDDLDALDDDLDEALALPDAWVERIDAEAQRWSDRLRMADTWGDRDRRLSVDGVLEGLEQLDRLRQRKREGAQGERKQERAEGRADTRQRERADAASRDDDRRRERQDRASRDDGRRRGRDDSTTDARQRKRERAASSTD
jgi:hypothetical protein